MASNLPYVNAYGVITKTLDKIKTAATPSRFTQDFLSTKLGLKGGSNKPVIPFLKRIGFLGSDGSPTELYKRFRNPSHAGSAAAQALRGGYGPLYEINEFAHDLSDKDLRGLVVQVTGGEPESGTTRAIVGSFKALKAVSKFDAEAALDDSDTEEQEVPEEKKGKGSIDEPTSKLKMGLSYTINLNLPATSDIAVFNAIFKSLKEYLLR